MKKIQLAVLLFASLLVAPSFASVFYLNNKGPGVPYTISRFVDGYPSPMRPVISPSGYGFDKAHIAWPSGLLVGSEEWVFAAGHDGLKWGSVGLWKTSDGVNYVRVGAVITADAVEGEIRMPTTTYDPDDLSAPFKMWYGAVINPQGLATQMRYATSQDGITWVKHGAVFTAAAPFDGTGLAPDYVCRDDSGTWHVFYEGFTSLSNANAVEATSPNPSGPYTKSTIYPADGISTAVLNVPKPGSALLNVTSAASLKVNGVYLLSDGNSTRTQVVTIASINGNSVLLEEPIHIQLTGASTLYSVAKRKVAPSYVKQDGANWTGYFTGFGPLDGVLAEYLFRVKKVGGLWVADLSSPELPFPSLLPEHLYSTENAEPLKTGPGCSQ